LQKGAQSPRPIGQTNDATDFLLVKRKWITGGNGRNSVIRDKNFERITMSKKFDLSEKRFVIVKKDEVRLFEDGLNKWATFNYSRWAHFVEQLAEIDECVAKLTAGQQDVKLQLHVGGGWYVSVTSGFYCVDPRKFYHLPGVGVRPTKTGIALHLYEWARLKAVAEEIRQRHPKVAQAQPCWTQATHFEGGANGLQRMQPLR
jgi:hypothetical protein